MEIDTYLRVLRRWLWLIVVMAVAAGGISYFLASRQAPVYVAQAELLVGPGVENPGSDLNAIRASSSIMQTFVGLATTRTVLQQVIDELHLDISPNKLASQVTATPNADSRVITLAVQASSRIQAVNIANALAKAVVQLQNQEQASGSALDSSQLTTRMKQLQDAAAASQSKIAQLEAQYKALADAQNKPPFTDEQARIDQLEQQLGSLGDPANSDQIQASQARIKQLEATLAATSDVNARRLILDQLSREDTLIADARTSLTDQKRLILDELGQERNRLSAMQLANIQQQNQVLNALTAERTQLADNQRELTGLYAPLQASLAGQIKIVDPASNAIPQTTNTSIIVGVASFAGLFLAITLAFAFEYFDDSIKTAKDLGRASQLRVLGTLRKPKQLQGKNGKGKALPALAAGPGSESLWSLSARLTSKNQSPISSLLVANAAPGDAASQVAATLALTIARSGKNVILIDANLQRPVLGALFKTKDAPGVSEWLSGQSDQLNPIPVEWAPSLWLIPAGAADSSADLLSPRLSQLVQGAENQADVVVIAAPPLSSSGDGFFLATLVQGAVVVAQRNRTHASVMREVVENLASTGVQVLGSILAEDGDLPIRANHALAGQSGPAPKSLPPKHEPHITATGAEPVNGKSRVNDAAADEARL